MNYKTLKSLEKLANTGICSGLPCEECPFDLFSYGCGYDADYPIPDNKRKSIVETHIAIRVIKELI